MSTLELSSPRRPRIIEDMAARKLNPQLTQPIELQRFAAWLKRSPDTRRPTRCDRFQLHLSSAAASICNRNRIMTGVGFCSASRCVATIWRLRFWHIKDRKSCRQC